MVVASAMSEPETAEDFAKRVAKDWDRLTVMAEINGWNAALNAARQKLPPEYSIRLRDLYKEQLP